MTTSINNVFYLKHSKSQQKLEALQSLEKTKDDQLWTQCRLLPRGPLYLISSHFAVEKKGMTQISWAFKTKWDLFKIFDKSLQKNEDLQIVKNAIGKAIQDQKNIVLLRKLYAVLMDDTKSISEKQVAFQEIAQIKPSLDGQIKHCLTVSKQFKQKPLEVITGNPEYLKHIQTTIHRMIWVIKQGYTDCSKHETFF